MNKEVNDIIWKMEQVEVRIYSLIQEELRYRIPELKRQYGINDEDDKMIIPDALKSVFQRLLDDVYYNEYY
jgi:hypothetical protein